MSEKIKVIQSSGKRKAAIARAVLRYPAKGQININKTPLELYEPEIQSCLLYTSPSPRD